MEAIDICNNALYLIGQGISIESLTEESYEAQLCGSLYDAVFKRCLERADWSFCRKSVTISSSDLVSSNNSPYAYAYKLPDDLIKVLYIQPDTSADGVNTYTADLRFDYRNSSGSKLLIASRPAPFVLHYQGYVDLDVCPAEFIEIFEYSLAARLAAELIKGEIGVNTGTSYTQRAGDLIKSLAHSDLPVEIPVDKVTADILSLMGQMVTADLESRRRAVDFISRRYEETLLYAEEMYQWSFTRKEYRCTKSSGSGIPHLYAYDLPDDFLKALYIVPDTFTEQDGNKIYSYDELFDYRIEGDEHKLITSATAPFTLVYQAAVTDDDLIPASIKEAVKYQIAADFLTSFYKQRQTQNESSSEGVSTNDAQQYLQQAQTILTGAWASDRQIELPLDAQTRNILALVGKLNDADLTVQRKAAQYISSRYEDVLLRIESMHNWSFFRKSQHYTSATSGNTPHEYSAALPDDFLSALYIIPDDFESDGGNTLYEADTLFDYRVESDARKLIVSSAAPFTLVYQAAVTDLNLVPPALKEAVNYTIASDYISSFFKQEQMNGASKLDGVSTNDAQLYLQKADAAVDALWKTDKPVELPLVPDVADVLALVGQSITTDLTVQRRAAQYISTRYPGVLETVENMHHWSFARRSQHYNTAAGSSTPHLYSYDLPDDFQQALYIIPDNYEQADGNVLYEADVLFDFRIESNEHKLICSAASDFTLVYQAVVLDKDLVPAAIKEAVKYYIASDYIATFFKQEQGGGTSKLDGVSTNDAQLYLQKADALVASIWAADKDVELPLRPFTADILALVGQSTVTDLIVQRRAAQYIEHRYAAVLRRIEEQYNWSFTRREQHYDAAAGEGVPHMNAYKLPDDFVRALFIVPDDFLQKDGNMLFTYDELFDYRINDEEHQLITSASPPFTLVYQSEVTDDALIPASIKEAAKYYIASDYIATFFKQTATQTENSSDGVSSNDAQLYMQKGDNLIEAAWNADIKVYLPFDERTRRVSDLLGLSIETQPVENQRRFADAVSRTYPAVFKQVLRQFNWSFTRKDEVITEDYLIQDAVSLPWHFTYRIPEDVEHILFLAEVRADSRIETMARPDRFYIPFDKRNYKGQLVLVTDHKPFFAIHYQAKIDDMSLLDPLIIQGLDYLTASRLVYSVVEASDTAANKAARNDAEHFINLAQLVLNEAMVRDAQQGSYSVKQKTLPSFARARR